jgi:hypothetical protein
VVEAYLGGTLAAGMAGPAGPDIESIRLRREERAVLALLRARLVAESASVRRSA